MINSTALYFTIDTPRRYTLMRGSINNAQGSGSGRRVFVIVSD